MYSNRKYLKINYDQTKYLHFSEIPLLEDIVINDEICISAVNPMDGYTMLGFNLSHSKDLSSPLEFNLNKKKFNIVEFYLWLHVYESTPFPLKMQVLYGCMFGAFLYSCEVWGNIEKISESLRTSERNAIKTCLGVKKGTPSNIIYVEINKPDIISVIKQRQYNFFSKFYNMEESESIAKSNLMI